LRVFKTSPTSYSLTVLLSPPSLAVVTFSRCLSVYGLLKQLSTNSCKIFEERDVALATKLPILVMIPITIRIHEFLTDFAIAKKG